jgi:hypothetical protein
VEAQCVLTGAGLIIGQLVTRHLESGIRAACDRFGPRWSMARLGIFKLLFSPFPPPYRHVQLVFAQLILDKY